MKIHIDDEKLESPGCIQALDDLFRRVQIDEITFEGKRFTRFMAEVARLALQRKIAMRGATPETLRGLDWLVTGGLQNIH